MSHTDTGPTASGKLRALAGLGVHLTVAQPGGTAATDADVRFAPIDCAGDVGEPGGLRWNARSLRRLLSDVRPGIVHIDEEPDTQGAAAMAKAALRLDIPFIVFSWRSLPHKRALLERRRYQHILRDARGVIGGNHLATALLHADAPTLPSTTIPQEGVQLPPAPERTARTPEMPLRIGMIGRLVPERGVDMLFRAISQVFGAWTLEIIGTGPEQEALEVLAQRLGLASRLEWRGGMDRATVDAQWSRFDCVVMPTLATETWVEQFSPMLIRAMAAEVAPIVTEVGALPEIVGDAGVVINNEETLTATLQQFLAEPARHHALGQAARRHVLREYPDAVIAERTLAFWQACLGHKPTSDGER